MATYNPVTQYGSPTGANSLALIQLLGSIAGEGPFVLPITPWFAGDVWDVNPQGAKLITKKNVPLHIAKMFPWQGHWVAVGRSNLWIEVTRGMWTTGSKINDLGGSHDFDPTDWSVSPEVMRIAATNNICLMMVGLLNGVYSGTPKDEFGVAIDHPGLSKCIDQIYGGNICVKQGDTGNYKSCNPADPTIASSVKWFNGYENFDFLQPASYIPVLEALQNRRDMAGNAISGFAQNGLKLWIPPVKYERMRILHTVMEQLVSSGIVSSVKANYQVDTGGTPQTNEQVLYGSQTNSMFGRLLVESIPGMRSDMGVLKAIPPQGAPMAKLFAYAHGGSAGSYGIQNDPNAQDVGSTVPHHAFYMWGPGSPAHFGIPGVTEPGDQMFNVITNEGAAMISGFSSQFLFEGAAS